MPHSRPVRCVDDMTTVRLIVSAAERRTDSEQSASGKGFGSTSVMNLKLDKLSLDHPAISPIPLPSLRRHKNLLRPRVRALEQGRVRSGPLLFV